MGSEPCLLSSTWADLAVQDPEEDPLDAENQEPTDELNCVRLGQDEGNYDDAVGDSSSELKGTVPVENC